LGQHFLVRVLEVTPDEVRVSFPGRDYPIEGMQVSLECHDEAGFDYFTANVLQGPCAEGEGIVLNRPVGPKRHWHRASQRVPTDLTVQVRDQGRVRTYDAALVDISAGGIRVRTDAPFDFGTPVEVFLSLPGEPRHTLQCQIVDQIPSPDPDGSAVKQFCMSFTQVDPGAAESIARYVRQRLAELHPA
jgi:Tfp pilus assembly protein PilZ